MNRPAWIKAFSSGIPAITFALMTLCLTPSSTLARGQAAPQPQVVEYVDLARYTGLWYEIASNPTLFERGCVGTTATYTARPDGLIDVLNRC